LFSGYVAVKFIAVVLKINSPYSPGSPARHQKHYITNKPLDAMSRGLFFGFRGTGLNTSGD
jgi:hypothetical protein